ncbi:hypothetical protein CIRG_09932 [Coccidioides immitis RMSCC 2394]|uniref:RING-type domain-containing protein n=1 Tax=Coccidioides immitis RMSCC 2394 TaxID=404692 RepID=A0A0J6YNK2_COCIT|nr:hypothetical protein CIRG_09932 [Coccidioides immitis RMSCC 2394]
MSSAAESGRAVIVIDSDGGTDRSQPPPRRLRKRPRTDYSYAEYEPLLDDLAPTDASPAGMSSPPKKRKVLNLSLLLETASRGIYDVVDAKDAEIKKLEEQVQHLQEEMSRKDERVSKLEIEVHELRCQCQCPICYEIPSEWRTLLCGHRFCPECVSSGVMTCGMCRQDNTGYIKSY